MLRIRYAMRHRNLPKSEGSGSGPAGRISKLRKLVTALIRHERIEGKFMYMDETRGYVELLVQHAVQNGPHHQETMDLLDYWIVEKDLIPKLFEVLVPRYQKAHTFTAIHQLPLTYPGEPHKMAVLELKGNPWPPIKTNHRDVSGNLINQLLQAAKKDYRQQKYAEISQNMAESASASHNQDVETISEDLLKTNLQELSSPPQSTS